MSAVLQSLFDRSVKHVLAQGRPSGHEHTLDNLPGGQTQTIFRCDYRSPEGLQCAAGIFITDYKPEMENQPWHMLMNVVGYVKCVEPNAAAHSFLIEALQDAHDDAATTADFLQTFKDNVALIAQRYGLTIPFED